MLRDVADDGLAAILNRHVLHGDGRLAIVAIAVERLHLGRKRAGQPAQCAPGTVLPGDVFAHLRGDGHIASPSHERDTICATSMASTESLGLMLFTIEIMKPRLTSSGLSSVHAGLHQLSEDAMHRVTIGDPQCVRHELFAKLRIWMVDGESV